MFGWLFGSRGHQSREYLQDSRLEDVIALIQVLGLDKYTNRTESALTKTLRRPQSAESWVELAGRHPEFFRVSDGGAVALIARLLTASGEEGKELTPEYIHGLVEAAIRIHQGQLQRKQILRATWAVILFSLLPQLGNLLTLLVTRAK